MPIRRILVTLAAVLGLLVTTAPASSAQPPAAAAPAALPMSCTWYGCSYVANYSWSDASILVARYWQGTYYNSGARRLYPGQNSRRYWNDVNAFLIPSGCYAYDPQRGTFYGGRWYKPSAGFSYGINVTC